MVGFPLRCARWFIILCVFAVTLTTCLRAATLPLNFTETTIGGSWNEAVGITFANDGRMFVWERAGRVWIVENGVKLATPLIDIRDEVGGWRDFGLLGFALDPNFYSNGYVYLLYVVDHHHLANYGTPNYNPNTDEYYRATIGRITRYTARASDGFHTVDPNSRLVLVGESIDKGFPVLHESHGVGSLVFGADGTLLAACGDGASYSSTDVGSAAETYYSAGLSEGIIRPKENIGAFRSQMVDSLNGKVIRIDPATGNAIASNPFYDAANSRSARSRVWALGLRNPCRMTRQPGTGSINPADANPGVLYIGDVGWGTWEDLQVCTAPGQNFGWPVFEGLDVHSGYFGSNTYNQDAPNPLYGTGGCTQQYFYFRDLLIQDTLNPPSWPNPCNGSQQIPSSLFRFVHTRPAIDWRHGASQSRTGIYSGNDAAVINIGAAGSPVSGPQFAGNCSIGGVWYTGTDFPSTYQNTLFSADFGAQWIKNFTFDANHKPVSVRNFLDGGGGIVFVATHPINGALYYISWSTVVKKISYTAAVNQPPVAVIASDKTYGPGPLTVQFNGSSSTDPEGFALTYDWNFGDGSAHSSSVNPAHIFTAPGGVPTPYTVTLTVRDNQSATGTTTRVISVNNTPPLVTITSPTDGCKYPMTGDTVYNLSADISDTEHAANQLTCQWQTFLHHNEHEHSEPPDFNCSTTTVISPIGCDGNTYYYRLVLTVTDPGGLSTTREVRVYPDCPIQSPTAFGLQGEYFDNIDLTGSKLKRIDPTINFDWSSGSPDPSMGADTFSVRWMGKVLPQFSETFTFYATTDDGFRLWIDNILVIDSWIDQATERSGSIALWAGAKADIKIEYYENGGGAVAKLAWSSPSTPKATVPQSALFPPQTPVAFQQDNGTDGLVIMEAENNTYNLSQGSKSWTATTPSGYSGSGALQATPNSGTSVNTGYAMGSPRLDFLVNFVKTGTHYIWVRGQGPSGSDDTLHAGLDGAVISTCDRMSGFNSSWAWSKNTLDGAVATINVINPGLHTINVWMREDGFIIDKLLLTVNSSYTPSGAGPAESSKIGDAPPSISDILNQTINEDTAAGPLSFTIADASTALNTLIVTGTSSNPTLVPNANIVFGGCGANRTVTVMPAANQSGSATITVTVSDGASSGSDSFVLTVNAVNDSPTISNIANQSTTANLATAAIPFTVGDVETAASSLTLNKSSSNTTLVPTANIVFGGGGANRTVTVTPAANQTGTATITVTVTDGNGGSASDTFVLSVNPVANLSVSTVALPNPVVAGYNLAYTATVVNAGPHTANNVTLTDVLPGSFVFVSAASSQGNCSFASGTLTGNLGSLASGASAIVTLTVKPTLAGNLNNTFNVTASEFDPSPANNATTVPVTVKADSDSDGIPDDWEIANGLNPSSSSDATLDTDGDGFSNMQEYLAGTNPNDPASALGITETAPVGNNACINLTTSPGKIYRVECDDNYPGGLWLPVGSDVVGTGSVVQVTDTGAASQGKRVYRVLLVP